MKPRFLIAIVGVAGVVFLEAYALYQGINGVALAAAIGGVTAIIGYGIGRR